MSTAAEKEPTTEPATIQPFILVCQHDGERLTSVDFTRNAHVLFAESAEHMFCDVSLDELLAAERCLRQAANRIDHWIAAKRFVEG
jgi:hypothetical protein